MRDLRRNQRKMYYSLYGGQSEGSGFDVLDTVAKYSAPVEFRASLSAGKSDAEDSPFGKDVSYDRIISTVNKALPITETSLIWYETEPIFREDGSVDASSADYKVAAAPLDGLDGVRIAIKRIGKSNIPQGSTGDKTGDKLVDDENDGDNPGDDAPNRTVVDDLEDW